MSKKSWHTGTIKNNETVWLREQADAEEKKRVAELQKQLEEERRIEEIQQLEIESGRLDPSEVKRRQRIEWMYEDVENAHTRAAKERKAKEEEEALLGKKSVKLSSANGKDPEKLRLVDAERKLREDPLLAIEQTRRKALTSAAFSTRVSGGAITKETREKQARIAAKLARKAERREIREGRKRRRMERAVAPAPGRKEENVSGAKDNSAYGLHMPTGGSQVRVQRRFERKETCGETYRRRDRSIARESPSFVANTASADPANRLKEMEDRAAELYRNRRERRRSRDEREELEYREEEEKRIWTSRNTMMADFAYDAVRNRNDAISDRIQQNRR